MEVFLFGLLLLAVLYCYALVHDYKSRKAYNAFEEADSMLNSDSPSESQVAILIDKLEEYNYNGSTDAILSHIKGKFERKFGRKWKSSAL